MTTAQEKLTKKISQHLRNKPGTILLFEEDNMFCGCVFHELEITRRADSSAFQPFAQTKKEPVARTFCVVGIAGDRKPTKEESLYMQTYADLGCLSFVARDVADVEHGLKNKGYGE